MYSKHTLPNNVRVILAPQNATKTVTVLVLFGVGSRYEEKRINGISHFIEHMMFKGTKRRPTALSISKELDAVGAEYNAYTSKEVTGYWIKTSHDKLELALDLVSDMLYNSKFDADEIEREKKVICEEQHMYRDNPMMHVDTLLERIMFEPSSLGWDIGGDDEVIMSMTRNDMVHFRDSHYHGKNLVVGVAGNIDEDKSLTLVKKHFGVSWEKGVNANRHSPFKRRLQTKPRVLVHYKDTEQVQVDMGFHSFAYTDPRVYAAALLGTILGGGMSSRLFIAIRERRGLCYSIRARHESYLDTGVFSIQSGLDKSRIKEALTEICKQLHSIAAKGVTAAELKRAQDNARGRTAIALEDSENVVSWFVGQEVLTKKISTPEEKLAKLDAVTREDVQKIAKYLFQTKNINFAIIGPYKDAKEFMPLLKI